MSRAWRGAAILLLGLLTAALFRFAPVGFGMAAAAVTLLVALKLGQSEPRPGRGVAAGCFALAALLSLIGAVPDLWPCGIGCSGAVDYQTLYGVPVVWLAAVTDGVAALLLLSGGNGLRGGVATIAELWACCLIGTRLFYLWLSVELHLACGHCLAIHTLALASLCGLTRGRAPLVLRLCLLVASPLLLRQLYAWDLARADGSTAIVADPKPDVTPAAPTAARETVPPPSATPVAPTPESPAPGRQGARTAAPATPEAARLAAAADLGRRISATKPSLRVELVVSFSCGHCKETFAPLQSDLKPFAAQGVELVVRHLYPRKEKASVELAKLAFAAAARGRYSEVMTTIFDVRSTIISATKDPTKKGPAAMAAAIERMRDQAALTLEGVKAALDLSAELTLLADHASAFDQLVREDELVIKKLGANGEMPQVFLIDPATGGTLDHLDQPTPAAVVKAVERCLRR